MNLDIEKAIDMLLEAAGGGTDELSAKLCMIEWGEETGTYVLRRGDEPV